MQAFLENLFGDELPPDLRVAVFTTPAKRTRFYADYRELERDALIECLSENVYFGLGLIRGAPQGRGKLADIGGIGALWCDIDVSSPAHPKPNLPQSIEEAEGILRAMPLLPSIIVQSGHGLHAYWLFKETWLFESDEERTRAASLAKRWHGKVCSIAAKHQWAIENLGDLTRVLRLPGTFNHNGSSGPIHVQIVESHDQRRYTVEDFEPFLPPEEDNQPPACVIGELILKPDANPPAEKLLELASASPSFWNTWNRNRSDLADPSQSGCDLSMATIAALSGWNDQEIADLIVAARRKHNENPQKALRDHYIRRTIEKAKQAAAAAEHEPVDLSGLLGKFSIVEPEPADKRVTKR